MIDVVCDVKLQGSSLMSLQQCAQFPDVFIGTVAQNRLFGQKGFVFVQDRKL